MLWWKKHLAKHCGYSKDYWWRHEVSRGLSRKMLNQGNGRNIQQARKRMEIRGLELMLAGDRAVVVNLPCIWWWVTTGLNYRANLEADGLKYLNSSPLRVPECILLNIREIIMAMRFKKRQKSSLFRRGGLPSPRSGIFPLLLLHSSYLKYFTLGMSKITITWNM